MVQKEPGRRGRPRTHDPATALDAALGLFWQKGLEGASLDELATVMNMNRPSIYLAFGDKDTLYRAAVERFRAHLGVALNELDDCDDLATGLIRFFHGAIRLYTSGDDPKGCLIMCTAPAVALIHPTVRGDLFQIMKAIDAALLRRIKHAVDSGRLHGGVAPRTLAMTLQAILQSLALRSRAGESSASLRRFAKEAVVLCLPRSRGE